MSRRRRICFIDRLHNGKGNTGAIHPQHHHYNGITHDS